MISTEFQFESNWRVRATVDEVYGILSEPVEFMFWWPTVYLDVREVEPGNKDGVGRVVKLHTKGWLPYRLNWTATCIEVNKPFGIKIEATGDLDGHGEWNFRQDGDFVDIRYDWFVDTGRGWMTRLSPFLKPLFEANHRWAMNEGEKALVTELERRREEK